MQPEDNSINLTSDIYKENNNNNNQKKKKPRCGIKIYKVTETF